MSRSHALSEKVSFVGTMPSIHLRPDASKGATVGEGAGLLHYSLMGGISVLAHTCASTGFGGGAGRTCDRESQERRRVELLVSSELTV
jgi:hypothetical protein